MIVTARQPTRDPPRCAMRVGCAASVTEAARTRKGTMRANAAGGVTTSRREPSAPQTADTLRTSDQGGGLWRSSPRELSVEPGQQAVSATRLATLAASGVTPAARSAGYD